MADNRTLHCLRWLPGGNDDVSGVVPEAEVAVNRQGTAETECEVVSEYGATVD